MPSASIHPTNELDIFDGGPAVDRKYSNSSGSSGNGDHNHNNMDKQYYSEHDFDDMIAGVIEPTKRSSGRHDHHQQQQQQEEYNEYEQDQFSSDDDHNHDDDDEYQQQQHQGPMVDMLPNARGSTSEDEDDNGDANVSLNSDDISGGSDISDVERQQNTKGSNNGNSKSKKRDNFHPRPLINDDESTVDMRPPAPVNQSVSSYVEALNQAQTRKNRIVKLGILLIFVGIIVGIVLGVVSATSSGNNNNGEGKELNSELEYNGGENNNTSSGLGSNQISLKEGYNGSTYSPTISPVYYFNNEPSPIVSNSLTSENDESTSPTVRPTPMPFSTNAPTTVRPTPVPFAMTEPPVTDVPTPEPTPNPTTSPVTDEPTYDPTPMPSPQPSLEPTFLITPPPTPNPTPYPTPKPFTITFPPTPRPITPRPIVTPTSPFVPTSPFIPTIPTVSGGSPSSLTFHCAEVRYTSNWNELLNFDCTAPCSGLGMDSECLSGFRCRSDEGNCL